LHNAPSVGQKCFSTKLTLFKLVIANSMRTSREQTVNRCEQINVLLIRGNA